MVGDVPVVGMDGRHRSATFGSVWYLLLMAVSRAGVRFIGYAF